MASDLIGDEGQPRRSPTGTVNRERGHGSYFGHTGTGQPAQLPPGRCALQQNTSRKAVLSLLHVDWMVKPP